MAEVKEAEMVSCAQMIINAQETHDAMRLDLTVSGHALTALWDNRSNFICQLDRTGLLAMKFGLYDGDKRKIFRLAAEMKAKQAEA